MVPYIILLHFISITTSSIFGYSSVTLYSLIKMLSNFSLSLLKHFMISSDLLPLTLVIEQTSWHVMIKWTCHTIQCIPFNASEFYVQMPFCFYWILFRAHFKSYFSPNVFWEYICSLPSLLIFKIKALDLEVEGILKIM